MADSAPEERLTLTDVAQDEAFLALVEHALVALAHEVLAAEAPVEGGDWYGGPVDRDGSARVSVRARFAAWAALYSAQAARPAALAVLTGTRVPPNPWHAPWITDRLRALWTTLAHAHIGAGVIR